MSDTITLTGVVASDPDFNNANGSARLTFRLASTQRRLNKQTNEWEDVNTNWYSVTAWKRLAENAGTSLAKGDRVIVSGRLTIREYDRKDGSKGTSVDINAETLGHDLFWGTTRYTKAGSSSSAAPSGNEWTAPASEWAAPASEWTPAPAASAWPADEAPVF